MIEFKPSQDQPVVDFAGAMLLKRHGAPYAVRLSGSVLIKTGPIHCGRTLPVPLYRLFWWRAMYRNLAWTLNRPGRRLPLMRRPNAEPAEGPVTPAAHPKNVQRAIDEGL